MNKIRWIHFSDLHLGGDDSGETSIMRRELPTYIAHLNETFDYAFCSGDIKDWNTDYRGASEYIRSLCSASHTDIRQLFIVPGNHDIDVNNEKRAELIEHITDWNSDYYQSSKGTVSKEDISLLKSGQEAFHGFIADLFGRERAEMYSKPHFTVITEHLNILHLDSTLTYGKEHKRDFVIGIQMLQQALDACDRQKPTVILTHYSFDYLAQDEKNAVEKLLSHYNVQLWFAGERQNALGWKEELFEEELKTITREVNSRYLGEYISNSLNRIKRRFRIGRDFVGDLYDLIVSEMVLLKPGNGRVSFSHQIFRDYLAAVYLHNCLAEDASGDRLWHDEEIHKGVVQYLRFMEDARVWDAGGMICRMLEPYRGREIAPDDHFISNILNCWLPVGNGKRDLSGLDLRRVSLSEHLKVQFPGTININNAWLEKETLINDKHHDRIAGFSFSHDHHTLAVVSSNGLVSIINLLTQSQMIVRVLLPEPGQAFQIGFTSEDYLVVCTGRETYKWTSFSYDKTEKGSPEDIVCCPLDNENVQKQIESLEKQLKESRLEGIIRCSSENGRYLAVGFESGFVQVWDVPGQKCLAVFSLSDSQITTVAFTKDGKIAALGSGGKLVQIWDMEECKWIKTLSFPKRVSGLRLPREGNSLECRFSDGTYYMVDLETSSMEVAERPKTKPFISKTLRGYLRSRGIADSNIQSSPGGNAIVLTQDGEAYTWDEKLKKFNPCPGHNSRVSAIAMCDSDERFAASYSPENYPSEKRDGRRRAELDNQKLVRVRIVKTGQCQWRLPTKKRDISKLRFFTGNRIILAAYATNGDILLWELINRVVFGKEWGHWENVEIIRNNQSEPLECAFPDNGKDFISAYADGTILIRPFSTSSASRKIATIPGIDAGVFRWDDLKCDDSLKQMLMGYQHKDS